MGGGREEYGLFVCVLMCTREAGACVFGCVCIGMYMSCVFERGEAQMPSCGGLHSYTSPAPWREENPVPGRAGRWGRGGEVVEGGFCFSVKALSHPRSQAAQGMWVIPD